ncbi:MAG: hypothetical protein HY525_17255 [Betaproteobacteria bacterium]|nr:hypothetical protein [Betaproteobacteria bacterium]
MFVLIQFAGRKLGVPLSQLEVIEANGETREAVEDWRYWVAMGYEFQCFVGRGFRFCLRPRRDLISASES